MIKQGEVEGKQTILSKEAGEEAWTAVAQEMSGTIY
jgi:hypothetical protein